MNDFIKCICPTIDINIEGLFCKLVNYRGTQPQVVLEYVKRQPNILTYKFNNNQTVFDYFYEKIMYESYHPKYAIEWETVLLIIIQLVNSIEDPNIIKFNKKYILRLQSTHRTLYDIFKLLVKEEFDMGDPEFLVYSIIARGELCKLEALSNFYIIEDYIGVIDVALRFGRDYIIEWFLDTLKIDLSLYGNVMDFENYIDNQRYIFYNEHIACDDTIIKKQIGAKQNYINAVNIILNCYQNKITSKTLIIWCELIKTNTVPADVIHLIINRLDNPLSITDDFGEFNKLIFGDEWCDRSILVQRCLDLERELEDSNYRYDVLYSKFICSE